MKSNSTISLQIPYQFSRIKRFDLKKSFKYAFLRFYCTYMYIFLLIEQNKNRVKKAIESVFECSSSSL